MKKEDTAFNELLGKEAGIIATLKSLDPQILIEIVRVTTMICFLTRVQRLWTNAKLVRGWQGVNLYYRYLGEMALPSYLVMEKGVEALREVGLEERDLKYLNSITGVMVKGTERTISNFLFKDRGRFPLSPEGLEAVIHLLDQKRAELLSRWENLPEEVQECLRTAVLTDRLEHLLGIARR